MSKGSGARPRIVPREDYNKNFDKSMEGAKTLVPSCDYCLNLQSSKGIKKCENCISWSNFKVK